MTVRTIEGTILTGRELRPIHGRVIIEDGAISAIEEESVASSSIVVPAFINAHTHLGDSVLKDPDTSAGLDALVAPPDGLKHRTLRETDGSELIEGMRSSLKLMQRGGTGACYDFREGGPEGVHQLETAADGLAIDALGFGRGDPAVLDVADGYGASGAADAEFEPARNEARSREKPFGIHAGEVDSGDINAALDLNPDFLVHMVHAQELHFERVADRSMPVVCCPRSNLVTGVGLPPIETLADRTTVALGTDNVMLNGPSMLREMALTAKLFDLSADEVLRMATVNGAELLDRDDGVIEVDRPARLIVFDGDSDNLVNAVDPVRSIVRRAMLTDIDEVILH